MATADAETPAEIDAAVGDAVRADEPVLVEIPTDPLEPQASEWMSD
jgi:acetolactate synthase-1/2/3 large subunit